MTYHRTLVRESRRTVRENRRRVRLKGREENIIIKKGREKKRKEVEENRRAAHALKASRLPTTPAPKEKHRKNLLVRVMMLMNPPEFDMLRLKMS
jgi:hypothetical protein